MLKFKSLILRGVNWVLKRNLLLIFTILFLTGCSLDETIKEGKSVLEKGEEVLEKGEEVATNLNNKVNKVTSILDGNIREVQNTKVFEEDFTFKELIDNTTQNPVWKNESGDYVTVQAEVNGYDDLEEIILGFPYSEEGISLANAGIFTSIDGAIKVNGERHEVSGDEVLAILFEIYEKK